MNGDDLIGCVQLLIILFVTAVTIALQRRGSKKEAPRPVLVEEEEEEAPAPTPTPAPPREAPRAPIVEFAAEPPPPDLWERVDPFVRLDPAQLAFVFQEVFRRAESVGRIRLTTW